MTPPTIEIEVRQLRKRLRENQALAGVSLRFRPGMMHGVIGPDGAGKTTLLRILAGLLKPDEGEVVFRAGDAVLAFDRVRPGIAYMPQQQSLYPDLTVSEHLDFFRDLYQLPLASYAPRRSELLEITRLDRFQERPAGQLSGGMYKKLGLMCALLRSPRILLLDEPTNGVDPISRREFWELLYRLVEQHILVIITTAYMDEAERCGDAHVLHNGHLLASGDPRRLLADAGAATFEELFLSMTREPALD
jgi:ABC-2 type transport system ATP-binding protein